MPELPEVEHLKRTLEPALVGARIASVRVLRRDVVRIGSQRGPKRLPAAALLAGATIERLVRHGKQLAIVAADRRAICVHLGMSGSMWFESTAAFRKPKTGPHVHCVWNVDKPGSPDRKGLLLFHDPRRFGGLWCFHTVDELRRSRWEALGPDALTADANKLAKTASASQRAIKAALLDQSVIAGVGNIYADEALFAAGIHPAARCVEIKPDKWELLAHSIRDVMRAAIDSGGSTIRNYRDGNGRPGWFALRHRVYGRGSEPCIICGTTLSQMLIAQRTTVFCRICQRRRRGSRRTTMGPTA